MMTKQRSRANRDTVKCSGKPALALTILLTLAMTPVQAVDRRGTIIPDAALCDQAAQRAAADHGVPPELMRAITRVESGRTHNGAATAWPWTLNVAGRGAFYASREDALARIRELLTTGQDNFDVGCFQINHLWHGQEFDATNEMLDPWVNADYAARFLRTLHDEKGDWTEAVGAYHSRTSDLADIYLRKINTVLAGLDPVDPPVRPRTERATTRVNTYPLLNGSSGARSSGSLVPVVADDSTRRSLF